MDSSAASSKFYQHALFLKTWLKAPGRVGSVIPSSVALAQRVAQIASRQDGIIIELGAGTGSLTAALVNSKIDLAKLYILEIDPKLCRMLRERFPGVNVIHADARYLKRVLRQNSIEPRRIGAIVSSIPFLSLPNTLKHKILLQIFSILPAGRPLIQYTYGPRSPISRGVLERFRRRAKRVETILRNIPPATVWTF